MGPMSIRVATYFPFNVTCYLNGHSFVAQELTRAGVRFRKADNAFIGVADVAALQAAADRLSPAVLQRRCAYSHSASSTSRKQKFHSIGCKCLVARWSADDGSPRRGRLSSVAMGGAAANG